MKAYCLVYSTVEDPNTFEEYRRRVMPTLEPHEGRFIVRGGSFSALEGEMPYQRIAIIEFPSRANAEAWYRSPAYQQILPLRKSSARSQFILVEGLS